ncbi:MAG: hypothetical protein JNM56_19235 [Planctomycetia bacterium]|nr:hypothetical protein [Planctomycetia bacterium]
MRPSLASRYTWVIASLLSLSAAPLLGAAPGREGPLRLGSTDDRLDPQEYYRFRELSQGTRAIVSFDDAETAANRTTLDKAARWYSYRLTWSEHQQGQGTAGMHALVEEAIKQFPVARPRQPLDEEQRNFVQVFGGLLRQRVQEVLRDPQPIVRINAARLLAHLAAAGLPEAADTLLTLLKDPAENDGVKLFALRGLKHLLAQEMPEQPTAAEAARWQAAVQALLDFARRPPALAADAPADEIDGYRYLRREALRGLALVGDPPPGVAKDLPRQVALTLARVLCQEGLQPEASLAEQVEASAGLCRMHRCFTSEEAEALVHRLGQFTIEYVQHYLREAQHPGGPVQVPWKLCAMRLRIGLEELKTATQETPLHARIAGLTPQAALLLARIDWGRELPDPVELDRWLQQHPPRNPAALQRALAP